jgi:hypothetical protein
MEQQESLADLPPQLQHKLQAALSKVESVAKERFLRGPKGKLPQGAIPVPVVKWLVRFPPEWAVAFNEYGVEGELDDWAGILETVLGQLQRRILHQYPDHNSEMSRVMFRYCCKLSDSLRSMIGDLWPKELGDEIQVVLHIVLCATFVGHDDSGLSKMIQTTLEAGGMPYGWVGRHPEGGRLIVYWPYQQAPEFEAP